MNSHNRYYFNLFIVYIQGEQKVRRILVNIVISHKRETELFTTLCYDIPCGYNYSFNNKAKRGNYGTAQKFQVKNAHQVTHHFEEHDRIKLTMQIGGCYLNP